MIAPLVDLFSIFISIFYIAVCSCSKRANVKYKDPFSVSNSAFVFIELMIRRIPYVVTFRCLFVCGQAAYAKKPKERLDNISHSRGQTQNIKIQVSTQ